MEAEKRKRPRHSPRDDGIEIFSRETKIIGKLENISKNGIINHPDNESGLYWHKLSNGELMS